MKCRFERNGLKPELRTKKQNRLKAGLQYTEPEPTGVSALPVGIRSGAARIAKGGDFALGGNGGGFAGSRGGGAGFARGVGGEWRKGDFGAVGEVVADGGYGFSGAVAEDGVVAEEEEGVFPPELMRAGLAEGAAFELDVESVVGLGGDGEDEVGDAFFKAFGFELAGADGGDGNVFAGLEGFGFGAEERAVGDGVEEMEHGPFAGVEGGPGDDGALLGVFGGFLGAGAWHGRTAFWTGWTGFQNFRIREWVRRRRGCGGCRW